ncbi:MAG TPA: isochorismatase family cysteine hydrolase [Gemmatimonadales bacterium]|jgi:nicotinamidase-related amidase
MKLDPKKTAVLSMDIQPPIVAMAGGAEEILPRASAVVEHARQTGALLIHVGLGFEPGYPEINPNHPRFSTLKERGIFIKGTDSAKIHKAIYRAGDLVIYKHRVSAFSGNELEMVLRSKGIEHLVLFGIATSGIVLSTLRQAADLDFRCVVIKDACFDADPEVHRVLTEKIFVSQSTVMSAEAFQSE